VPRKSRSWKKDGVEASGTAGIDRESQPPPAARADDHIQPQKLEDEQDGQAAKEAAASKSNSRGGTRSDSPADAYAITEAH